MNDYNKWTDWEKKILKSIEFLCGDGKAHPESLAMQTVVEITDTVKSLLEAQAKAYRGAVPKKVESPISFIEKEKSEIRGYNQAIDETLTAMDKIEKGE